MSKKRRLTSTDMLVEMHTDIKEIKEKLVPEIHKEIAVLKVKNTIWSSLAGIIGGSLAVLGFKISN